MRGKRLVGLVIACLVTVAVVTYVSSGPIVRFIIASWLSQLMT